MSDSVDSESILQFCQITNAEPPLALSYLKVADGNVEQAVSLFLENGGAPLEPAGPEPSATMRWTSPDPVPLAEHWVDPEADGVRAPLAPRREVLVDEDPLDFNPGANVYASHTAPLRTAFDQLPRATRAQEAFRDFAAETSALQADSASEAAKVNRLADLFRPPFDLIHSVDLDQGRKMAKEEQKWVLINIQKISEFACQLLNRDLWSDHTVKQAINESFIFLQYSSESTEGARYTQFYPLGRYPHIAIIDPITGERVKQWDQVMSPAEFLQEVSDFLDSHPLVRSSQKHTKRQKRPESYRDVSSMTEEEQIQAAIAASMGEAVTTNVNDTLPTSSNAATSSMLPPLSPQGSSKETTTEPSTKASPITLSDDEEQEDEADNKLAAVYHSIAPQETAEPAPGGETTRVQFKLSDGTRIVRRFNKESSVKDLIAFVKARVPAANDRMLNILYHRHNLMDYVHQSIAEAGLQNASITVDT
ncbi:UBX domain protein Ubx2 [Dimargaris verticillata]|uniref:UBX domain protein Ubx2 n=1 Tax=Dimargaris verticillata TaxID=2761393 RepID=A0A9W8EE31_9FUNG|nr:UBX domain protein Ubx2 [Dimargaris verticillata]